MQDKEIARLGHLVRRIVRDSDSQYEAWLSDTLNHVGQCGMSRAPEAESYTDRSTPEQVVDLGNRLRA